MWIELLSYNEVPFKLFIRLYLKVFLPNIIYLKTLTSNSEAGMRKFFSAKKMPAGLAGILKLV